MLLVRRSVFVKPGRGRPPHDLCARERAGAGYSFSCDDAQCQRSVDDGTPSCVCVQEAKALVEARRTEEISLAKHRRRRSGHNLSATG